MNERQQSHIDYYLRRLRSRILFCEKSPFSPLPVASSFETHSAGRVSRDPVTCYLGRLTASGRRTMSYRLRFVARLFGYPDAAAFPRATLRYDQVLAHLVESGRAPATVNACPCAMVGVARAACRALVTPRCWRSSKPSYGDSVSLDGRDPAYERAVRKHDQE